MVEAGGNGWWYVRRQRDGQKGFVPASFFIEGVQPPAAAAIRKQLMPNRPPPPTPLSPRGTKSGAETPPRLFGQPRRSHELVDMQVEQILTNSNDSTRGPASPRGSGPDEVKALTASRREKLNVLDELLDKMDTLAPSAPTTGAVEKKPERFVVSVRWPDEISGAEAYSRVRWLLRHLFMFLFSLAACSTRHE